MTERVTTSKWRAYDERPDRCLQQHRRTPELWRIVRIDGRGRRHITYAACIDPPEGDGFFRLLTDARDAVRAIIATRFTKRVSPA